MTALMFAAWYGQAEIVRLLLDRGANVNTEDNSGNTALDYASSGNAEAAQLLTAAGGKARSGRMERR